MSSRVNNNNNKKCEKKYCGVCHKAGLPEKDYTSHFTKSVPGPHGIVICPTILNNECSYCLQYGHFKNSCPAIAKNSRMQNKIDFEEKRKTLSQPAPAPLQKTQYKGTFSALADSSDDEQPVLQKVSTKRNRQDDTPTKTPVNPVKDQWPALSTIKGSVNRFIDQPSFASIAAKPIVEKLPDVMFPFGFSYSIITKSGIKQAPVKKESPATQQMVQKKKYKSWADDESDSEYEDDNTAW